LQGGLPQSQRSLLQAMFAKVLDLSGSNASSWCLPHWLPQLAQGTYVIVLPVSMITVNRLGGVPR
jgi:hypothetical protein